MGYDYDEQVEKGHGRIETRRVWVTRDVDWLRKRGQWAGLRSVICVESVRQVLDSAGGPANITTHRRYYITSLDHRHRGQDAAFFASLVRAHWSIENQLHWSLDVTFAEDDCRVRQGHGAENLARLRRIALNLLKKETSSKRSLAGKRLHAGRSQDYLLKVLGLANEMRSPWTRPPESTRNAIGMLSWWLPHGNDHGSSQMKQTAIAAVVALLCCVTASGEGVLHYDMGFADARGGEGGAVLRVTNLNAEGPGSLRAAIDAKGPRVVVFEVGGVINLEGGHLEIAEPFITIAGQTAPAPGITIIRGGLSISTHHVLIQHLRVRPGDAGRPKRSGWAPDGLSTGGGAYDVIVDHCSLTWAVDENLSASGPRMADPKVNSHRITFSNCIIAEGLNNASHEKGPHSKGSLISDSCTDIAVFGNLYAHNVARNPYFKAFTTGVIVNNVVYNPGKVAIQLNYVPSEWKGTGVTPQGCRVSVVGNVLQHGIDTKTTLAFVGSLGSAYLEDNAAYRKDGTPAAITGGSIVVLEEKPVWPRRLEALSATEVVAHVVKHVGARPRERDPVDARIIREFQERRGRIIDSQQEVGGYPEYPPTTRPLDIPKENTQAWLARLAAELE